VGDGPLSFGCVIIQEDFAPSFMITWHSIQRWRFVVLYINSWLGGMQWFTGGTARAGALPSMMGWDRVSEYIDR
jgi:hypothetical protein